LLKSIFSLNLFEPIHQKMKKHLLLLMLAISLLSDASFAQSITCSQLFPDSTIPHFSMGGSRIGWVKKTGNFHSHYYMDTLLNVTSFADSSLEARHLDTISGNTFFSGNDFCASTVDKNGNLIGLFYDLDCITDSLINGTMYPFGFSCYYWYDYATQQKTYFQYYYAEFWMPSSLNNSTLLDQIFSYRILWSGDTMILRAQQVGDNAFNTGVCLKFLNYNLVDGGSTYNGDWNMMKCFIDLDNKINTLYDLNWIVNDGVNYSYELMPSGGFNSFSDAVKDSIGNLYVQFNDSLLIKNNTSQLTIAVPYNSFYTKNLLCIDHLNRLWYVSEDSLFLYTNNTWTLFHLDFNNFPNGGIPLPDFHGTFFEYAKNKFVLSYSTDFRNRDGNGLIFFTYNDTSTVVSNPNHVTGHVFYDLNNNGTQDSGEPNLSNQIVSAGSNATNTWQDGNYNLYLPFGSNNVTLNNSLPYINTVPVNHNLLFIGPTSIDTAGIDFMLQTAAAINDVKIEAFAILQGTTLGYYALAYSNTGNAPASGTITFNHNTNLVLANSSIAPTSVAPGILTWNYTNLLPFETSIIYLFFNATGINIGDTLNSTANITPLAGDAIPADNTTNFSKIVTGPFDPNNKEAIQNGMATNTIYNDDYIEYLINFQNVGNDTAHTVIIKDTLDANLDLSTLQIIGASHLQNFGIYDRTVQFTFNNINLPDSGANLQGSNGFVAYKIKPLNGLNLGTQINNEAAIYFDNNQPVITNNAFATMSSVTGIKKPNNFGSIQIYPNPASTILVVDHLSKIGSIIIKDVLGKEVISSSIINTKMLIDVSNLSNGIYFVSINNSEVQKIVINK